MSYHMVQYCVKYHPTFEAPPFTAFMPSRNSCLINRFHTLQNDRFRNSFIPNLFFTLHKTMGGVPYSSRFGTAPLAARQNGHAHATGGPLTIVRTKPGDTKLIVCVWHPFPQWRADEMM